MYNTFAIDGAVLSSTATPLDELLRLRGQCESQAKTQALYSRRDPSWIDFPDAQKARVAAEQAYRKMAPMPHKAKALALREWLVIALHTCQPPDRVGIVRKLRLGHTLKRSRIPPTTHPSLTLSPSTSPRSTSKHIPSTTPGPAMASHWT